MIRDEMKYSYKLNNSLVTGSSAKTLFPTAHNIILVRRLNNLWIVI